jgi:hypothetical protein
MAALREAKITRPACVRLLLLEQQQTYTPGQATDAHVEVITDPLDEICGSRVLSRGTASDLWRRDISAVRRPMR